MRNILLDLDGTLTDPREGILGCIKEALARLGEPCPPDAQLERCIGPPLHASFSDMFGAGSPKVARAVALYRERFTAIGILENKVYPGVPEALARFQELGANVMVATSKPTVFAERIVGHFGLREHLGAVFGSERDGTRSDKAELIAHILESRAILASETCMIGDRAHDMRGAVANGVTAIGALWGYGSREELLDAGASVLCDEPRQLPELLRRLS